jgi:hypothetical protein
MHTCVLRATVSCCSTVPVSLYSLVELGAVNVLKMEPSLQRALARRQTPRKWAARHTAIVQLLDTGGHIILLVFFVGELFHPLAGRKSPVA